MRGRVRVLLRTGWTWWELLATPAYVLDAVVDELIAQQHAQQQAGADGVPGEEPVIEVE